MQYIFLIHNFCDVTFQQFLVFLFSNPIIWKYSEKWEIKLKEVEYSPRRKIIQGLGKPSDITMYRVSQRPKNKINRKRSVNYSLPLIWYGFNFKYFFIFWSSCFFWHPGAYICSSGNTDNTQYKLEKIYFKRINKTFPRTLIST